MSRNYEIQVEIFPCPYKDEPRITDVLVDWGLEIESDCESFDNEDHDGWSFWGNIQLTNGKTEEDKHEQLRVLLPDRAITTRWRYVDDLPWDDVIETEPVKASR
jgi:hypothetical protein